MKLFRAEVRMGYHDKNLIAKYFRAASLFEAGVLAKAYFGNYQQYSLVEEPNW